MRWSPPRTVSATRALRDRNALAVLHHLWSPGSGEPVAVTGTDLMAATGLSRATVHDVCGELIQRGWVQELPDQRQHGEYTKGRPARRYAVDPGAGAVVGVDAGEHRLAAQVGDLLGRPLATLSRRVGHAVDRTPVGERLDALETLVRDALAEAGVAQPLAVAVGVPAPVAPEGRTEFSGNPYWAFMNPDLRVELQRRAGWRTLVDNDANLAALAESRCGQGRGARTQVTLLAGERLGAGVVDDGRLLRGARGGVGEMRYLDLVEGVGSADGIARVVRDLAARAGDPARTGRPVQAEEVFAAAAAGDPVAGAVVERAGRRLTRVVVTLAGMHDPERIILAGAVAGSGDALVEVVERELPGFLDLPRPDVRASTLGRDVVVLGAVQRALEDVREDALSIRVAAASPG